MQNDLTITTSTAALIAGSLRSTGVDWRGLPLLVDGQSRYPGCEFGSPPPDSSTAVFPFP